MPKNRKNNADRWMPPRVYMGRSAYEYHPKGGGNIRLCDKTSTPAQVWVAWEALINNRENDHNLTGLITKFFQSADFYELSVETQKDYRKYSNKVIAVFGEMPPDTIKPEHIRKYMDRRGLKSRVQANREKAFMSRVYRWAYERGYVNGNPTKGVKQFRENSRKRYITHEEYNAIYSVAPDIVKVAMELAYLCCARQNDILALKKAQLLPEGILIQQSKTSIVQIKAWSDRLRDAITRASSLPLNKGASSVYVLHQASGHRYTRDGFNSRWQKAKSLARSEYPDLLFDFTFHDLKAKGISDLEGNLYDKQVISGHKNIEQTARYDRKIAIVPVVGGQ